MPNTAVGKLLKQKKTAKQTLAKKMSFSCKKPLLGIFLDNELTRQNAEKINIIFKGITAIDVEVVILADSNLENFSMSNMIILPYSRQNRKLLLESADMSLSFPFSDIEEMLLHGVIPISISRPEIIDYNPNHETGNSFIFKEDDPWYIFAALVRARETFRFPYDWKHIVREGLSSVGNVNY
ncbi:hypothetical protein GF366_04180 [Candidatus Peregrinibacteria bacterium]|nr:hypothetical protein [Candidatus Peregrinibacteria bacterium]